MRALQLTEFSGIDGLQVTDVPQPEPGPGQVLVKVTAAGLNYSDIMITRNTYAETPPLPYIMGREFAGTVAALGDGVQVFEVGEAVTGMSGRGGAMADYVAVNERALYRVAEGVEPEQAMVLLAQGLTAYHIVHDVGRLQEGERVLIHAAAGGVGVLAVQLARHAGAEVYGTASSAEKCNLIEELGAIAINYSTADWVDEFKGHTMGKGAHLILESVGGDIYLQSFREALEVMGRMVVYGNASESSAKLSNNELLVSGKSVHGYFLPHYYHPKRFQRITMAWDALNKAVQNDRLQILIGGSYKLEDGADAFRLMESRKSTGKVVIRP